ncbi:amidohydrolase/deacetylase family metallohydrolase [Daejeonella sp.]|uniref:amidohydrolase/deacetylase family metallohydrolase n=1 Tax=Daejeonella sp. TaxID=2805397 RepID=UPI0027B9F446|nr:amidohydrolase/deacetylase family metallohydrolase [Daejeonella sp.]
MKYKHFYFFTLLIFISLSMKAQQNQQSDNEKPYNIVIKGGHVIDPKNNINTLMDVAIKNGKIALIAKNIDASKGTQVVSANGMYVTPGLIDIHVHFFWGHDGDAYMNAPASLPADGFTFPAGVTTVVDAGSPGWKTFELYKKQTIQGSQTRVLAFLNIVGQGMAGGKYENDINEMDSQKAAEMAKKYPNDIVGFKLAHFNGRTWVPTDRLMEAGRLANLPVIVDFGGASPFLPLDSLFNVKFRPGDIYTHAFGGNGSTSPNGRESIVDVTTNKVKPYVIKAQNRGIIFDVGFGGSSFLFNQGTPAIKSGFYPNSISTDLHTGSMNNAMKNMPNIMSLFMAMGMDLQSVIKASTWNPAQQIKRPELGNLSIGSEADIAIFTVRNGNFGYYARDGKIAGKQRLETEMTIRAGKIVYNLNAIAEPNILPNPPRQRSANATPRPASN